MFIFIFFMLLSNDRTTSFFKIVRLLPFWKHWNFSRFLCVCADKHLPMCRGTIFLHIYHSPPYSFAQIIPLNPIFMGHRFNPMLTSLLRHSNGFDQSNCVLLPKRKGHAIWLVRRILWTTSRAQGRVTIFFYPSTTLKNHKGGISNVKFSYNTFSK
jgi:hypothetical protein